MKNAARKFAAPLFLLVGWIFYGFATNGTPNQDEYPAASAAIGIPVGDLYFVALSVVGLLVIVLYVALLGASGGLRRDSYARMLLVTAATLPIAAVAGFSAFLMFSFLKQTAFSVLSAAAFGGSLVAACRSWFVRIRQVPG